MLYPYWTPSEADYSYPGGERRYATVGTYRSPEDARITTRFDEGLPLSLYMMRDSFTNALLPYLSDAFRDAHYTRQMPLALESDVALAADVVVLEIAERRLPELLSAAPIVMAPQADAFEAIGGRDGAGGGLRVWAADVGGLAAGDGLRVWGYATGGVPDGYDAVYVMFSANGSTMCFEAFPVFERSLAARNGVALPDGGESAPFSLLIPRLPQGAYDVSVLWRTADGGIVYSGTLEV
jgi:hypothetical protein